jgi:hypothetical protein
VGTLKRTWTAGWLASWRGVALSSHSHAVAVNRGKFSSGGGGGGGSTLRAKSAGDEAIGDCASVDLASVDNTSPGARTPTPAARRSDAISVRCRLATA